MRDGVDREAELDFHSSLVAYRHLLSTYRQVLNAMNVFPVADSDTGSNMLRTVDAILKEVDPAFDQTQMASAVARAALEGQGNSGLLLGQYLAGFASGLAEEGIVAALVRGADLARQALSAPVEGTLVSVADAAALGAGDNLTEVVADARGRAALALARTPTQLPVLAEAGVLDSGGSGLSLFFDGLWMNAAGLAQVDPVMEGTDHSAQVGAGFELQFFTQGIERSELMVALEAIGDSVVVAQSGDRMSAHVHVAEVGPAIVQLASSLGELPEGLQVEPLLQSTTGAGASR